METVNKESNSLTWSTYILNSTISTRSHHLKNFFLLLDLIPGPTAWWTSTLSTTLPRAGTERGLGLSTVCLTGNIHSHLVKNWIHWQCKKPKKRLFNRLKMRNSRLIFYCAKFSTIFTHLWKFAHHWKVGKNEMKWLLSFAWTIEGTLLYAQNRFCLVQFPLCLV